MGHTPPEFTILLRPHAFAPLAPQTTPEWESPLQGRAERWVKAVWKDAEPGSPVGLQSRVLNLKQVPCQKAQSNAYPSLGGRGSIRRGSTVDGWGCPP